MNPKVSSDEDISHLRQAHACEIFRSNFYESKHVSTSVSCSDLDQLIISEKARPSLLICPLELAGKTLGVISRYSPNAISNVLLEAIDEATIQIYNDSIRDMQYDGSNNDGPVNNDIKEALKYHREIKASSSETSSTTEDTSPLGAIIGRKEVIASGIRTILRLTKDL